MNTGTKITAFAVALAASFGTAYGVGAAFDPVRPPAAGANAPGPGHAHDTADDEGAAQPAGGLAISEAGYTLDLRTPHVGFGRPAELRFLIRDADGHPLTSYRRAHEKELHLIVVSRDLTSYRHLHPVRAADGTWSTPSASPAPGTTGSSPTSPPPRRAAGTSRWARTSPWPGTTGPAAPRRSPGRRPWTATP